MRGILSALVGLRPANRRSPYSHGVLMREEFEPRVMPAAVVLQPDLALGNIGAVTDGPPAQMVFGPDGRLYVSLANFGSPTGPTVDSFAYDANGNLSDQRAVAFTGGALGIAFGPVTLGVFGAPGVVTTTGIYLVDMARAG